MKNLKASKFLSFPSTLIGWLALCFSISSTIIWVFILLGGGFENHFHNFKVWHFLAFTCFEFFTLHLTSFALLKNERSIFIIIGVVPAFYFLLFIILTFSQDVLEWNSNFYKV